MFVFFRHKESFYYNTHVRDYQHLCTGSVRHKRPRTESEENNNFIKMLRLATSSVEFSTDIQMTKQLDWGDIGLPIGPTPANIFVGSRTALLLGTMIRPLFYCWYVDGWFAVSRQTTKVPDFIASSFKLLKLISVS